MELGTFAFMHVRGRGSSKGQCLIYKHGKGLVNDNMYVDIESSLLDVDSGIF